jgi:hypothetical protein
MPLPSATDPKLRKTQVTRVDCYYLGGEPGTIELYNLHAIDFVDSAKKFPDEWALVEAVESLPQFEAFKPPRGPDVLKIIDKRNIPNFPGDQIAPPPPMAEMIPLHEKRLPGGGPLIPRMG